MKVYSAYFLDQKQHKGSVIATEYPNKKDLLKEISKWMDVLPDMVIKIEAKSK